MMYPQDEGVIKAPGFGDPSRHIRVGLLTERVDPIEIERRLEAKEHPVLAWSSWERIEMPRATLWILAVALSALLFLMIFLCVVAPSPKIRYVEASSLRDTTVMGRDVAAHARILAHTRDGIAHGQLLAGNSPEELSAARHAAQNIVRLRFAYNPLAVNSAFRQLTVGATPEGTRQLLAATAPGSLTRLAIEQIILGDSGTVSLREFGIGSYSIGLSKGVVRVVIPVIGRFHSRHFPYTGALSGLPLYERIVVTVRKGPDTQWRLDAIGTGTIDSILVATWREYHIATRPRPAVVMDGVIVPPESIWTRAVGRGVSYRNQN